MVSQRTIQCRGYPYDFAPNLAWRTNVSVGATYSRRTGYSYDDAGQLTVAWATNGAGGLESGESRGYAYDFAQNLSRRTNSAGDSPVNAHANHLNQLTNGLGFNSYTHDRRGNLTFADAGSWAHSFTYDHENQCTSAGGYYGPYKSDYVYDGRGRLRKRTDWAWTGSSWYPNGEVRYLYDGMHLIQERNSGNTPTVGYTRGLDLRARLKSQSAESQASRPSITRISATTIQPTALDSVFS